MCPCTSACMEEGKRGRGKGKEEWRRMTGKMESEEMREEETDNRGEMRGGGEERDEHLWSGLS